MIFCLYPEVIDIILINMIGNLLIFMT